MRSWVSLVLAATALGLGSLMPVRGWADEPAAVSCDGFLPGFDGEAKEKTCVIANVQDGTTTTNTRQLVVLDHAFFMIVLYDQAGYKTQLPEHSLEQIIDESHMFSAAGDWQTPQTIQGLDVAVFNGVLKGRKSSDICAVFSRYSGSPGNDYDSSFGPAFKNHVFGFYCAVPVSVAPEQQGEGFYSVVQGVIAQLRLPAAE